jgi:hypothetical protein
MATAVLAWFAMPAADAQTFNWGSDVFSDLVDSNGVKLGETFVFELGSFDGGFTPDTSNTDQWFSYWRVFDRANYNYGQYLPDPPDPLLPPEPYDFFTGVAYVNKDGTSSSPYATSAFDFGGLDAYIWVRNSNDALPGSEWFLASAGNWNFPAAFPGCCDNSEVIQWSINDLASTPPVWGRQGDEKGGGVFTDDNSHYLQTYTFIPEPSSALLVAFASMAGIMRRRRNPH